MTSESTRPAVRPGHLSLDPTLLLGLALSAVPAVLVFNEAIPLRFCALTPVLAFLVTNWRVPAARATRDPAVTPKNLVWAAFALELLVGPLLFALDGPVAWVFPVPQTWGAIAGAALILAISFPSWALGCVLCARALPKRPPRPWGPAPRWLIALFLALGLVGLGLLVLQVARGDLHVGVQNSFVTQANTPEGVVQVLRLVLRPFLAAAGVAIFSNVIARGLASSPKAKWLFWGAAALCIALIVASYVTVEWRRAPLLAPALALVAATALILRRPTLRTTMWLLVAGIVGFFAIRFLRTPDASLALLFGLSDDRATLIGAINTEVQSYGGGMQMIAFLLDHEHLLTRLHGLGQVYTALSPVPVIGEFARESTPVAFYNTLFLNRIDQTLPLAGQFYMDFGVPAVAVGFAIFGAATQALQDAFQRSGTLLQAFVWAGPAAWLAFSLGAGTTGLYQALVFLSLPSFVALAVMVRRSRAARPAS